MVGQAQTCTRKVPKTHRNFSDGRGRVYRLPLDSPDTRAGAGHSGRAGARSARTDSSRVVHRDQAVAIDGRPFAAPGVQHWLVQKIRVALARVALDPIRSLC